MADAPSTVSAASPASPANRGRHTRNFSDPRSTDGQSHSRGRGRGHRGHRGHRGGGGSRGQGRGQGDGLADNASLQSIEASPETNFGRPPGGFGGRLTGVAETKDESSTSVEVQKTEQEEAVAEDAEVCFICASPIEHLAIAPCNHQTCHICSLRLRALYKTRACAHCRTEAPIVIFTDSAEKKFQDFRDTDFVKIDENLGIKYEKDEVLEDTILLLRYNCPDKNCDVACLGWPDLHRHVKGKHQKVMCDLCTRNKKVFTHEHDLFSFGELKKHERFGDDRPGAEDQSGFKGHPECGFCKQRFYGDDELYTHCREKHERCHICDRRNEGRNPQYYLNYAELEKHFADNHFVCLDAECQANKTNVFESEMDLKAHQLSEHPNGISKGREARLINLSGFDLRTPYQPQRRGGRDNRERGIGRGRDPNAEPIPASSAQPMSRAELAYQRQMALVNAASGPGRAFGGSLTQQPAPAPRSRPQPSQPSVTTSTNTNQLPNLDTLTLDSNSTTQHSVSQTPQDQARALRHAAVTTRAQTLLQNNQTKLSQFRTHISAYRSGTTTAPDFIDACFSLFDCPSSELGKLIRELADLYEDDSKRQALLEAWNSWRSINEDYPSLPGPSGTLPGTGINDGLPNVSTGRRVLKLKSSTVQSSRSAVSRQGSWGNSLPPVMIRQTPSASASSRDTAFPALSSRGPNGGTGATNSMIWGFDPISTSSSTSTPRITTTSNPMATRTNITSRRPPTTMSPAQNSDMFPSLPSAPKPNVMIAGLNTRGTAKWGTNSGVSTPSPWASGAATPTGLSGPGAGGGGILDGGGIGASDGAKRKGKKGKKGEVLYHFG